MNRCNAGGIALSWVPSKYQHGNRFQANVKQLYTFEGMGRAEA
mgnify:CR=1 FL=1